MRNKLVASRRHLLRSGAVVALSAAAVAAGGASSDTARDAPPRSTLERILLKLTQERHSGAVSFVQTRGSVWRGASGYELVARRPAQRNDRFGIESVTKTFVAAVVLQLVGEGRLSLDESVERWLPGGVREGRRITIRELLNHTSGLASGMPTLFEPLSAQPPLLFRPGTSEAYANVNYVVLGAVVEKVTGRRLDRVVRDRIFRPLGLDDTSYGPTRFSRPLRARSWLGEPEVRTVPVTGDVGIVSTTADVAAFYSALLGGKVLSQAELSAMERTVATGTGTRAGLGLFRSSLPCGSAWGHGGNDDGYSDQVLVSDDGSKVVVVAQNALDEAATTAAAAAMYCAAP